MNNNKLGLKIVRINQGYADLLEINGDQLWTKNVWDIRKDLENIDNLDGSSAVLMLTCVESGHILTVASLIDGRISDCISAWIYIPATINIAGKELVELVESTKTEILANERDDEKLKHLFSKDYEPAPATKMAGRSAGEKCAYRSYGQKAKYTLSELLKDLCQSYYKNYKSIFLLDNSTNLRCLSGDDLSDKKVYSMVIVESKEIDSFVPYIGEQQFVGQMYAIEGEVMKIEWRRDGYKPIQTTSTILPGAQFSEPTPDKYVKLLPYNDIEVVDEDNRRVADYQLKVAGELIDNGADIPISEAKLKNVSVEISAKGYKPLTCQVDLMQSKQFILTKETYSYEFKIPLKKDKDYGTIKISGNREIKNSPIKGYVLEGGNVTSEHNSQYYLKFKPFPRKFWITCLVFSLIVLILGVCVGYALNDFIGKKVGDNTVEQLTPENAKQNNTITELEERNDNNAPKVATGNNDDYTLEAAISYLDTNNKWNRTEMEKFDDLNGLWDALNKRCFDDIIKYEAKLHKSATFSEVLQAFKANKHKNFSQIYFNNYDIRIRPEEGVSNGYINELNGVQTSSKPKKDNAKDKK